jgi:hypothetical protein
MTPCGPEWHRFANLDGGDRLWFRLGARMNDEFGTYIYRFGPRPDEAHSRTIWCYGDKGVPWTCASCGEAISTERFRPEPKENGRLAP